MKSTHRCAVSGRIHSLQSGYETFAGMVGADLAQLQNRGAVATWFLRQHSTRKKTGIVLRGSAVEWAPVATAPGSVIE
jgi:hypothetical protein